MKIRVVETHVFAKMIAALIKKNQLLREDYSDFKAFLAENPEKGDIIVGTGGIRKIRLKSASHGKSGGFRVCYYWFNQYNEIALLLIYAKNKKEDITRAEKKVLKNIITVIKGSLNEEQ